MRKIDRQRAKDKVKVDTKRIQHAKALPGRTAFTVDRLRVLSELPRQVIPAFTRSTETASRIPATARECCGKRKPHCGRRWLG